MTSEKTKNLPSYALRLGLCLVLLVWVGSAGANSGGAPDGYAGNPPNNQTCHSCHSDFAINLAPGTFVAPTPGTYTPGVTYTWGVTIVYSGQTRWGFELTTLLANGNQAGTLAPIVPSEVQLSDNPGTEPDYLTQTSFGSHPGVPMGMGWTYSWTAPAPGSGPVTIYAAGIAADNDGDTGGDYVYTYSVTLTESNGVENPFTPLPATSALLQAWPNPFNPNVTISLGNLMPHTPLNLDLMDITGRILSSTRLVSAGPSLLYPMDLHNLASGSYFLRLNTQEKLPQILRIVKTK
jgi:hypothetical protein